VGDSQTPDHEGLGRGDAGVHLPLLHDDLVEPCPRCQLGQGGNLADLGLELALEPQVPPRRLPAPAGSHLVDL
jgi:hypothetical protein